MKKNIAYLLLALFLFNCSDDETVASLSTIEIVTIGEIGLNQTQITSNITAEGGAAVTERGLCWSTSPNPTVSNTATNDGTGAGIYTSTMTNLMVNTNYYLRAYAINSVGVSYSEQEEFNTNLPEVSTNAISNIMTNSIDVEGEVTAEGGSEVIERGVCWSTNINPTILDNRTTEEGGQGLYTSTLTGLEVETTYYIRAYAVNNLGITYGNEIEFNTNLPTVTTTTISNIMTDSAESGGEVTDQGGSSVITRGICWSTNTNPTISDNTSSDGVGAGVYTSIVTGLTPNTIYYVRAYATNSTGIAYGNEVTFNTNLPTVTTAEITNIMATTAESGGEVTDEGGSEVIERGICWSIDSNPTIQDATTSDGDGIGVYTSIADELMANTIYYVRAYATNGSGTSYGDEVTFSIDLPTVQTIAATYINVSSTEVQAEVTDEGTLSVTERGVCWGTDPNPTIADNFLSNGAGLGIYTTSINGLIQDQVYYIRAYATSDSGTSYGDEIEFTNNDCIDTSETYLDNGFVTTYLTTQQEVDNFKDSHVHHLYIGDPNGSSDISDLTSLSCLTKANRIIIKDNPNLFSLAGLENLTRISLQLENSPNITSFAGLNNVTHASLQIINNPGLTSFAGLENVSHCSFDIIRDNANLANFSGLDNLQTIAVGYRFLVENNNALTDINLPNVTIINADVPWGAPHPRFTIRNNPNLVNISIPNAANDIDGEVRIHDNINLTSIDLQSITGVLYLDIRDNTQISNLDFSGLQTIHGRHYWTGNAAGVLRINDTKLTTMNGVFGNLSVRNLNAIIIGNNRLLQNLNGMSGVTFKGSLSIFDNPLLVNLSGPTFVANTIDNTSLSIINNNTLTHIDELATYVTANSLYSVNISGNANLLNINPLISVSCMTGGLKVNNNTSLSNLCPIATYANGYLADINSQNPSDNCSFEAVGNAYNPTAQDIVNGNCSQ